MNPEKPIEKVVEPAAKAGGTKIPVLGIAAGLTESVKEAQQAEKALERAPTILNAPNKNGRQPAAPPPSMEDGPYSKPSAPC